MPNVANFSGLSILDCSFRVLQPLPCYLETAKLKAQKNNQRFTKMHIKLKIEQHEPPTEKPGVKLRSTEG